MSNKTNDGKQLRELRRGVVPYCVLSLLSEREHYGFELLRRLSDQGGLVTSEGTVYPLLERLHKAGLLTSTWRKSDSGRSRKYYALTQEGSQTLTSFRKEWVRFRNLVDDVLEIPKVHR